MFSCYLFVCLFVSGLDQSDREQETSNKIEKYGIPRAVLNRIVFQFSILFIMNYFNTIIPTKQN